VLDCPAGSGALTRDLLKAGYDVVPADLFPGNFKLPGRQCIFLDMHEKFPLADESLDAIICVEGIEHLEDQFHFVRECHRVLRTGGRLLLTTPNILNLASRLKYFLTGFWSLYELPVNEVSKDPTHDHIGPISYPWLRYILHTNGFRVRQVITDRQRRGARGLWPLVPFIRAFTRYTVNQERDPAQRERNAEILQHVLSRDILFGRTLIVLAERLAEKGKWR
jgi:SAM-dependent methyltransferase